MYNSKIKNFSIFIDKFEKSESLSEKKFYLKLGFKYLSTSGIT